MISFNVESTQLVKLLHVVTYYNDEMCVYGVFKLNMSSLVTGVHIASLPPESVASLQKLVCVAVCSEESVAQRHAEESRPCQEVLDGSPMT